MNSPHVLLPYQQRWVQDKSPIKVIEKSRRIGISWAEAAEDALLASESGNRGSDVYYIGYNESMAQLWIEDVAFWAKNYNLAAEPMEQIVIKDDDKDILTFQIRFASGYKVTALSSRPNNIRGKKGKIVIDEAAFHPDLEGLLKAAIALLMWGGQVVVISTHDGIDNTFNQLLNEIRAGKKDYSLHRVTLDDALADGLYKRICLSLDQEWSEEAEEKWRQNLFEAYGDAANEELLCIPRSNSEIYFPSTLVEARMSAQYPVLRLSLKNEFSCEEEFTRYKKIQDWINENLQPLLFGLPKNLRCYFGMDFGRSNDLTAIAPIIELSTLNRYCPFIIELRNCPIRQQEQILYFMIDNFPCFVAGSMDGRGNGQAIAEFAKQRYGSRIEAMMLTGEKYRDIMPAYKAALEDGTFTLPSDADVLADHRMVRLENGVPKIPDSSRMKGTDGNSRHGDSVIGLVLGYHAAKTHAGASIYNQSLFKNDSQSRSNSRDFFTVESSVHSTGFVPMNSRSNLRNIW